MVQIALNHVFSVTQEGRNYFYFEKNNNLLYLDSIHLNPYCNVGDIDSRDITQPKSATTPYHVCNTRHTVIVLVTGPCRSLADPFMFLEENNPGFKMLAIFQEQVRQVVSRSSCSCQHPGRSGNGAKIAHFSASCTLGHCSVLKCSSQVGQYCCSIERCALNKEPLDSHRTKT